MAIVHGKFDPTLNGLSDQYEEFYDWEVKAETQLAEGVKFYHYAMKNFAQNVYVVEADLTNPNVVFETVMADELCLNPNANNNSNNGKKLRETLSETCTRRRAEGRNIVAGIDTGSLQFARRFPARIPHRIRRTGLHQQPDRAPVAFEPPSRLHLLRGPYRQLRQPQLHGLSQGERYGLRILLGERYDRPAQQHRRLRRRSLYFALPKGAASGHPQSGGQRCALRRGPLLAADDRQRRLVRRDGHGDRGRPQRSLGRGAVRERKDRLGASGDGRKRLRRWLRRSRWATLSGSTPTCLSAASPNRLSCTTPACTAS